MAEPGAADAPVPSDEPDFRHIVDGVPSFIFTFRPDGETEFVNRAVLDYFGLTAEELRAWQGSGNIFHPDDIAAVAAYWRQAIAARMPYTYEHRLRRADGVYRWFQLHAVPSFDPAGRLLRWYGSLTDIDDLKRAESDSRASERTLALLVDSIPAHVFTTSADGRLEWVNRRVLAYHGPSFDDLRDWDSSSILHPEDLSRALAGWQRGIAGGEPFELEHRVRRADGAYRWFTFRLVPLRDEQGRVLRWYGIATDIDDLKRAEELLRAGVRDLRLTLDSVPGLVYTMKPNGEVEFVNARIREYFGKSLEELVDWERIGVVHPDDLPRVRAALERTIARGEPYGPEQRLRRADGVYRWFQPRSLPLRDDAGHVLRWYCLLVDVDDLKRAEEGVQTLQSRLARATQLATVSQLAASIAHEVNQPLAAVVANGHACRSWLSTAPPNIERAAMSAERVIRDGNAAAQVIERTRALFLNAPAELRPLDLNDVIREVCALLAHDVRRRAVELVLDLDPDLPRVQADLVQMQQVMANLVRNGLEALDGVREGARELAISSCADAAEVTVSVEDSGGGLSASDKVFEPFYTTKPNGLGVGLSICRSVIRAHEGRLWAESSARGGATFRFALPRRPPAGEIGGARTDVDQTPR